MKRFLLHADSLLFACNHAPVRPATVAEKASCIRQYKVLSSEGIEAHLSNAEAERKYVCGNHIGGFLVMF